MNPKYTSVSIVGSSGFAVLVAKSLLKAKLFKDEIRIVSRKRQHELSSEEQIQKQLENACKMVPQPDKDKHLLDLKALGCTIECYDDQLGAEEYARVFKGTQVVVSCVGLSGVMNQIPMIEGARMAGVKWFLPSEFGASPGKSRLIPIDCPMINKKRVEEYLVHQHETSANPIDYTIVRTGLALDSINPRVIGLKLDKRAATLVGRGGTMASFTATNDIVKVIVSVLSRPEEMANRVINYAGSTCNMRDLIKVVTGKKCGENVKVISIEDAKQAFTDLLMKQDLSAFEIWARLLLEEGMARLDRNGVTLDNGMFKDIKPEPVKDTLTRLMNYLDTLPKGSLAGNTVKRSDTTTSVTDGLQAIKINEYNCSQAS